MERNFANRTLFHADNLPILRGMNSETVDLIATDPPFNKGRDFHATPDTLSQGARFQDRWSWTDDVQGEWVDAIKDDFPAVWSVIEFTRQSYGDDMGAFLCFMGVRLMEMQRILKPTGSLYLHCDSMASHYLKAMCDAVFGPNNFQNEIVWRRTTAHNDSKRYGANTDSILFYAKSDRWTWNPVYQPYDDSYKARFRRKDPDGRLWSDYDISAKGLSGGGYEYEYKGIRSLWRVPLDTMKRLDAEGRLHFTRSGGIRRKRYLDEMKGRPAQALWDDINAINSQARERVGYPTQKPLALYERIIQASSNPGDVVLDPFCGCATTPIAAERLGRQWVGIDIWEGAHQMILRRLRSEGLATPEGAFYDAEQPNLLTEGDVRLATRPPERTDEGDAAPLLKPTLRFQRPVERWQKLSHAEMRAELEDAQSWRDPGLVICAGCGRALEAPFMELDHVNPRAQGGENWITNRILLCRPCNGRKRHELTLIGLNNENKREGWMKDANAADEARQRAQIRAGLVRDNNGPTIG